MGNPTLFIELIEEILLRLPVRSLLRFKCVCKSWFSLISDPQFGISHFDLAAAPTHRLLLKFDTFYAQSIDAEDASAVYFPVPPPLFPPFYQYDVPYSPLPPHFYQYDVPYPNSLRTQYEILGSCRGFILLYYDRSADLILWNPSINVLRRLSNTKFRNIGRITSRYMYGFGYDASADDYLLVLIGQVNLKFIVYSFKTDTWDKYDDVSFEYIKEEFIPGTLLNGALHWVVFSFVEDIQIIAFDLTQRCLSEIPLFDDFDWYKYQLDGLSVIGECLGLCCSVQGPSRTEIWVMKEYRVQSSWTMSFVIHTVGFSPISVSKDGGIFGRDSSAGLKIFNDKKGLPESFLGCESSQRLYYGPNQQCAMYRESLLSLPNVFRETREKTSGKTSEDDYYDTSEDDDYYYTSEDDDYYYTSEDDQL